MSTATTTTDLNKVEFEQLIEVIEPLSDSFRRWSNAGADERDIDCIHARNVIASLERKVDYMLKRDQLMSKYGISEHDLMCQAMHQFAAMRH